MSIRLAATALLAAAPVIAVAQDLTFAFNNQTDLTVMEIYASPTDVESWEDDILGVDVLGAGETVSVTIADGRDRCTYDMRTVFSDGQVLDEQVNICELGSYTVNN